MLRLLYDILNFRGRHTQKGPCVPLTLDPHHELVLINRALTSFYNSRDRPDIVYRSNEDPSEGQRLERFL